MIRARIGKTGMEEHRALWEPTEEEPTGWDWGRWRSSRASQKECCLKLSRLAHLKRHRVLQSLSKK